MTSTESAQHAQRNLPTLCIRKEVTHATTLQRTKSKNLYNPKNHTKENRNPLVKEHFLQLSVILDAHLPHYSSLQYDTGITVLMGLRDYFNREENVFWAPTRVNQEKDRLTEFWREDSEPVIDETKIDEVREYIKFAAQIARPHLDKLRKERWVHNDVVTKCQDYLDWLTKL